MPAPGQSAEAPPSRIYANSSAENVEIVVRIQLFLELKKVKGNGSKIFEIALFGRERITVPRVS